MSKISILGCGWLGFPLAKSMLETGFSVKGSTTSTEKVELLEGCGIEPFQIILSEKQIIGDISNFLQDSETLVLDIPPRLRSTESENFVSKIEILIPFIERSEVKNVLFISSTSVYGDANSGSIDENSLLNPETESGKQLVQVEQVLKQNSFFKTTILRFGGLIGEDRHPVYHLSGRQNIENPNAPINLIHRDDCIGIITSIVQKNLWPETFNAVAPFHPTRKEYYSRKADALGLELPIFKSESQLSGKIILSDKIQMVAGYTFKRITDF